MKCNFVTHSIPEIIIFYDLASLPRTFVNLHVDKLTFYFTDKRRWFKINFKLKKQTFDNNTLQYNACYYIVINN